MRRKRIVQAGKCYHLVSRVAHKAFFFDEEEKDRFVDLLMRVEFFCCVGLKGSDTSVYVLLYMLDFDAADVLDYAAS